MLLLCGAAAAQEEARHLYIVQLADKPAASYTGEVAGLVATKPAPGQRLNVEAPHVQGYIAYLEQKKAAVLNSISAAQVRDSYNVVFNGFSAMLTDDEVRALKKSGGVAKISANALRHTTTSYTPTFLGLNKPGGLWDQAGGERAAGEDMIIGMLDTGVWPENPSFADRVDDHGAPSFTGTQVFDAPPARWKGVCQPGQGFSPANCNNKLIGARIYPPDPKYPISEYEYRSVRDSIGHGTHTASTAAGVSGVAATVAGVPMGKVGGMAPRARLAIYKVCWTADYGNGEQNSCPNDSTVAAVEQAVKDGVNVLSYSIGSSLGGGEFDDPVELAFLGAANAGVFVAAAGGNEGPANEEPQPVTNIAPWVTTVANSTHNRSYRARVKLGSGVVLDGVSNNANTPSAPLLLAKDAGKRGTRPDDIRIAQCYGPAESLGMPFDVEKVKGKILVCDRGGNYLADKVKNALAAGAAGVVIVNVDGGASTFPGQPYTLSMVHLGLAEGKTLKNYVASAGAAGTAALGDVYPVYDSNPAAAPIVAGSSSRGPNVADRNLLKPDLAAPGTDILAAGLPYMPTEEDFMAPYTGGKMPAPAWEFMTGTSMATPHISGIAAVLKQVHPDWSPAAIKSALMTTAFDTQSDGLAGAQWWDNSALNTGKLPWGQGAGQVAPSTAADPGLVYDAGPEDYRRFLCGQSLKVAIDCGGVTPLAASDLNLPSLGAEAVLSSQSLRRTVTNVGANSATYTASATLPGYKVEVSPATLTLAPGAKADFTVKLSRTTAPMHQWSYGKLTWSDGHGHQVRSPLVARAATLATLPYVYSEAASGSKLVPLLSGYTGPVGAVRSNLVAATQVASTIGKASEYADCWGSTEGVEVTPVTISPGTMLARFALYNADTSGGQDSDLDLYLLDGAGNQLGASAVAGSDEVLTMLNPPPGDYKVCVVGYAPKDGSASYKLSSWMVGPASGAGNLKLTVPGLLYQGKAGVAGYSWSGLESGKRFLGMVNFQYAGANEASTVIEIDTTDPLPLLRGGRAKKVKLK
ncbi:S8 family serine peptidase [Pseudoduganella sp. FT55W]|uniref:S8 family serine peptidase n=1 Tax=Duganella rivi TaxID=2666083 RepID=A0A7X4KBU0_9BURK|nr:S8 family peptidase [Duganella rivi]MYM67614.1 S8 family serine peptidase [Duganella rivi]